MVCSEINIYQREPNTISFICLREEDKYKAIWLSLSGLNIDMPVNFVKANGDRLFNVDFFEIFIKLISHESIHAVMIEMLDFTTSKSYDNLYHTKGEWWLP